MLVRNRPAVVEDVVPYDGPGGRLHLVHLEYIDGWEFPQADRVLWEHEFNSRILTDLTLPDLSSPTLAPDSPELFGAFVDAVRWSSLARLPGLSKKGDPGVVSPWYGAVRVEDYQLVPVLRARDMPRVNLLLADDVGLGKTIEAGLILSELIARRRIRRVLIIVPASLQLQWRDEMREKFGLDFVVMDRDEAFGIQREMGLDANPWATVPKIITSMDYLRQRDVLTAFLAATGRLERGPSLAWDLLIVDEAHNLAPLNFEQRSERSEMLAEISPHFEHRLFLTATPHNGYTSSFSGLLETLDPVRFRQRATLAEEDHRHIQAVMIRRLKSELNAQAKARGDPPRFASRTVDAIPHRPTEAERTLFEALRNYRQAGLSLLGQFSRQEQTVGRFIFSLLTKRLLSSSYAFARTWWRHVEGFGLEEASFAEVEVAQRRAQTELSDDEEKALREEDAVREGAAWLRRHGERLEMPAARVNEALQDLGWDRATVAAVASDGFDVAPKPPPDAKWAALWAWIEEYLREETGYRADERLILFTEYKHTHDYLIWRLRRKGLTEPALALLFGGSSLSDREQVKELFNDPESPLRILVATDVASEGLNLQLSCRYVVHYEIPWNPMRLEQRNGRVDRHGQERDVFTFHFVSQGDEDQHFLDHVVRKVNQAREDLGSVGVVIDAAVEDHFAGLAVDVRELDRRVESVRRNAPEQADLATARAETEESEGASRRLEEAERDLRLSPERMARLIAHAAELAGGRLQGTPDGAYRLARVPPSWEGIVDGTLRVRRGAQAGALRKIVFDPSYFEVEKGGRSVFRARPDAQLVRLGHLLVRRAQSSLRHRMWDPGPGSVRRWTITGSHGVDEPELRLYAQLTALNELRELLHQEVVEYAFRITRDGLENVEPSPKSRVRLDSEIVQRWRRWASEHWHALSSQLMTMLEHERQKYQAQVAGVLQELRHHEAEQQRQLFDARIAELTKEPTDRQMERLRHQLIEEQTRGLQLTFDPEERRRRERRLRELSERLSEAEQQRHRSHVERLARRLQEERQRTLEEVVPQRFSLARLDLQPLAVQLTVPIEPV